jgi:hypothetical protein
MSFVRILDRVWLAVLWVLNVLVSRFGALFFESSTFGSMGCMVYFFHVGHVIKFALFSVCNCNCSQFGLVVVVVAFRTLVGINQVFRIDS